MTDMIQSLPQQAGIYQYLDLSGRILYIGKAKNLAKRVKSYFNLTPHLKPKSTLSPRIQKMLSETHSLNYIVVENEHDALILENSLIKQLKPKYNILLRDDKTYPYLYINTEETFPRFELTRKIIQGKGIRYFGPFSTGARDILDSLYELLQIVQKKSCLKGKKACLFYQTAQCLAPCEYPVNKEIYFGMIRQGIDWIQNKHRLIKKLEEKMSFYAEEMRYEEAMTLRDRIERIRKSELSSQIDLASDENFDIFAIETVEGRGCIVRLFVREGKIVSSSHDLFNLPSHFSLDEAYERIIIDFYGTSVPPVIAPILCAYSFESIEWIREHLGKLFGKKAHIDIPLRGIKKELISLALRNAKELLRQPANKDDKLSNDLQNLCSLERRPDRIEVFDNSHFGGNAAVGAMIVYDENRFDKKSYRSYHLHTQDEYSQMREMLIRRIDSFSTNPPPDLWILDGGSTLRSLAIDLLNSHGVHLDVIAISKEKIDAKAHRAKGAARDILHTQDHTFRLESSDKRLQFVQKLRDEAHRSALAFHKKTKLKNDQQSKLFQIHGITLPKIQKLLEFYGTFDAISTSDFETLESLIGYKDAKNVQNFYALSTYK